jgi:hypothetical protein
MAISPLKADESRDFAASWIARNIEIDPFSIHDRRLFDGPLASFRRDAAQAGLSELDLEQGLGPIRDFIADAYAQAAAKWRAARVVTAEGSDMSNAPGPPGLLTGRSNLFR